MECSICYDHITQATGKVELSCSHTFHLSCIVKWLCLCQVENCPYCRQETSTHEKIPLIEQEQQGPQTEEEENNWVRLPNGHWIPRLEIPVQEQSFEEMPQEDPISWRRSVVNQNLQPLLQTVAAIRIQETFVKYKVRKHAATIIQRVYRGYHTRILLKNSLSS